MNYVKYAYAMSDLVKYIEEINQKGLRKEEITRDEILAKVKVIFEKRLGIYVIPKDHLVPRDNQEGIK